MSTADTSREPQRSDLEGVWAALRSQRLVVVLGDDEGAALTRKPRWSDVAADVGYPGDAAAVDPALIFQVARQLRGRRYIEDLLRKMESTDAADRSPPPIHSLITRFQTPTVIVTTAYHREIELAYEAVGRAFEVVAYTSANEWAGSVWHQKHNPSEQSEEMEKPSKLDVDPKSAHLVYRVRGAFETHEYQPGIVVDEDDLAQYLVRHGSASVVPTILQKHFEKSSFLFVGFDLSELRNRLVLQTLSRRFRNRAWQEPSDTKTSAVLSSEMRNGLRMMLIEPLQKEQARIQLLDHAFGRDEPELVGKIDIGGPPDTFIQDLFRKAEHFGRVQSGELATERLLIALEELGHTRGNEDIVQAAKDHLDRFKSEDASAFSTQSFSVRAQHSSVERILWKLHGVTTWDMAVDDLAQSLNRISTPREDDG